MLVKQEKKEKKREHVMKWKQEVGEVNERRNESPWVKKSDDSMFFVEGNNIRPDMNSHIYIVHTYD